MEKEKAELFVKATMATEQLKSMEMHLAKTTQDYQRKINHLKTSQNQY
jgi:coiled-coil domain-containing protein 78